MAAVGRLMNIPGILDGRVPSGFIQADGCSVAFIKPGLFPEILTVVYRRLDIRIAGIAYQQRFFFSDIIAAVEGQALQNIAVGEFYPYTVAEAVAEIEEVIDRDFNIAASELCLVLNGNIAEIHRYSLRRTPEEKNGKTDDDGGRNDFLDPVHCHVSILTLLQER